MVKVVTFAVALHDVCALLVVNVTRRAAGVGGDALTVEPRDVGVAESVFGEGPEVVEGEGLGGDAWAEAEDAAAGWVSEHGVAEAVDEVGGCGGFANRGNEVFLR